MSWNLMKMKLQIFCGTYEGDAKRYTGKSEKELLTY